MTIYRSVTETAAAWHCSPGRVRQWIKDGRLPAVRVGKIWCVPADAQRPKAARPGELMFGGLR